MGFSPQSDGAREAVLEVNTTNGGQAISNLTGTATPGVIQGNVQNTAGDTNLPSYTYPDTIALGTTPYTFTFRNTGNVTLLLPSTQTLTGPDAGQFSRSTNCGASLAPNATCTVTVTYNPTVVQTNATAALNVNPTNGGSSTVNLTATSLTPSPAVSVRDTGNTVDVTSRAFTANIGSSQAYVFTIRNSGDSLLSGVTNQTVTGTNAGEFGRTTTCGATLAVGATCTTTITFSPTRAGTRTATFTISPTNPLVTPAPKSVALTGEATGVSIVNDITDTVSPSAPAKRWLESLALAPGGTTPSDVVKVAFEVDAGFATQIQGVDIVGSTTTNDTAPTSGFQNIQSDENGEGGLSGGKVTIERKPGSTQALVRAEVPLSSTSMGTSAGNYGLGTGTDIIFACLGGTGENTNRRVWFRVRGSGGATSATVGSVVRFHNQAYACPYTQGPNLSNQRVLSVGGDALPNGTTVANADKNEASVMQFNTRTYGAGAVYPSSAGNVDAINWRIRNARTGDMFRIVNGNWAACTRPCTAQANYDQGARYVFPAGGAPQVQTLPVPGIPSRGRWIVEGAPQGSDENDDSMFNIGVLRINDHSGNSPTISFGGTLGLRPDTDTNYTITANVADPQDPTNSFDSQGGRAQVIEWDLNGNTTDGADGAGLRVPSGVRSFDQPHARRAHAGVRHHRQDPGSVHDSGQGHRQRVQRPLRKTLPNRRSSNSRRRSTRSRSRLQIRRTSKPMTPSRRTSCSTPATRTRKTPIASRSPRTPVTTDPSVAT